MAAATLVEQQLHHNAHPSDEEAGYEEDDDMDFNIAGENADAFAANRQLLNGVSQQHFEGAGDMSEGEEDDDEGEEDMEGVEEGFDDDGGELSDQDAEGEEDDDPRNDIGEEDPDEDEDADDDEEDGEGVGAVKIQPGHLSEDEDAASIQDDDESEASLDEDSNHSSEADSEAEVEAEWNGAAGEEDEDEDTEAADPNRCVFCQQDEEHDPSEEFEEYLACVVCGDNAHRQCARNSNALKDDDYAEQWRCPGCISNALEPDTVNEDVATVVSGRRSSVPKLARDLLPSQRGAIKPDSHSVFNHLIVDDDPMDGSRLLRKRKTSSIEPEDRIISPTRKRRKIGYNGSTNLNVVESEMPGNSRIHLALDEGAAETTGKGDVAEPVTPRAGRSLRIKAIAPSHAKIIKSTRTSLVISLSLDKPALATILYTMPKPKKKRPRPPTAARRESVSAAPPPYIPHTYSQPFYSFHDREMDESKSKPYGGILNEAEGDTSKTVPQPDDRRRFDDARQRAEEEWKVKTAIAQAEAETIKKPRKVSGPASQIECINFGGFEIDTWYAAPYPEEYSRNRVLFICEFCLKYMNSEYVAWRHKMKCPSKHPPGDEIYRDGSVSVFEVDGRKNPVYCQNLCLLAKLFLGSKTLYYDVEPFLFYVMTEYDELGCHFVGYFSKEKRPSSQNNVSCILTLPIHQRKGYGNLLIDFSYLLTRVEKKSGSPEKPLSDMGLVSYRNYWRLVLCYELRNQKIAFSIIELSERTGMTADDIVSALEGLRALVRDPETGTYALRLDYDFFNEYIKKWEDKKYVRLNPNGLVWTPYIQKHNNQNTIDNGPLNTMAQRDEDDDEVHPLQEGKRNPVVNGEFKNAPNGTKNGAGGKGHIGEVKDIGGKGSIDAMDIDSPEININGKGGGKGPVPTIESSLSPTSTRSRAALSSTFSVNGNKAGLSIDVPAANIPPSRFEVFPPVPGLRGLNKPRLNVSRPIRPASTPRTTSARPSASHRNSSRRSTGSRPRSSARRSSGATGRGPGRWPKGTKKSDFGNADSGPGLPPKLKTRSRLGVEVKLGDERSDDDIESEAEEKIEENDDAILFDETPAPSRRRNGMRGTESTRSSRSKGKGKAMVDEDDDSDDAELVTGDVDAEGEDE